MNALTTTEFKPSDTASVHLVNVGGKLRVSYEDFPQKPKTEISEVVYLDSWEGDLFRLLSYKYDWDGNGAEPIDRSVIKYAHKFVRSCLEMGAKEPAVVPSPSGGVQFEWFVGTHEMEVEIESATEFLVLHENGETNEVHEYSVRSDAEKKHLMQTIKEL